MTIAILTFVFLAAWVALYIAVIRPKLVAYRATAGIYAEITLIEDRWLATIGLRLKGAKVAILAFIVSAAPIISVGYDKLSGADWEQLRHAKTIDLVMFALGVIGPMVMAALHNSSLADAQAAEPVSTSTGA